jgi:hypothetical protein
MKHAITDFVGSFPIMVVILILAISCRNEDQTDSIPEIETNACANISSNKVSQSSEINHNDSLNWQKKTFEAKTNYPGFGSAPFKMEIEIY